MSSHVWPLTPDECFALIRPGANRADVRTYRGTWASKGTRNAKDLRIRVPRATSVHSR